MAECGTGGACCGGAVRDSYEYGPAPYVDGEVDTFAGPVPRVRTGLSRADRLGGLRMRLNLGREDYRVRPGLYAVGDPDDTAPVLVSANYKLSFDALRRHLGGRDAWILVLDTRGVNVWCAAGKGTFGTRELVNRIGVTQLAQVTSHRRLVVPQLGATGVSAHEVRAASGFSVTYGPVRAEDLPAFLDAGMKATPAMRRVTFPLAERAKLVGVELSVLWSRTGLIAAGVLAALAAASWAFAPAMLNVLAGTAVIALAAVVAGAVLVPLLLPYVPGRSFSLKGAIAGAAVIGALLLATSGGMPSLRGWGGWAIATAAASYVAMNFTGSSTYTSPSGVEWEMRRAIPAQVAAVVAGVALILAGVLLG